MSKNEKKLRVCEKGHKYYKTSDCPTCPKCESEREPGTAFLSLFSAPARSALEHAGIKTPRDLSKHTKAEILKLHGMGPASLPMLEKALTEKGLSFKKNK